MLKGSKGGGGLPGTGGMGWLAAHCTTILTLVPCCTHMLLQARARLDDLLRRQEHEEQQQRWGQQQQQPPPQGEVPQSESTNTPQRD